MPPSGYGAEPTGGVIGDVLRHLAEIGAGRTSITARAGNATQSFDVQVLPNAVASVTVTPARTDGRQGDVIRFTAVAKDRSGRVIEGVNPHWSFSPGKGVIDERGGFVGYEAGTYRVIADFGSQTGSAVIRLTHRDVRRPVTVVGRVPKRTGGTSEVWVHPNGRYVYTGAGSGARSPATRWISATSAGASRSLLARASR